MKNPGLFFAGGLDYPVSNYFLKKEGVMRTEQMKKRSIEKIINKNISKNISCDVYFK